MFSRSHVIHRHGQREACLPTDPKVLIATLEDRTSSFEQFVHDVLIHWSLAFSEYLN